MLFITVSQNTENTENARAGGEFKGLILASPVWYEFLAAGFQFFFCNFFCLQFSKQIAQNLFTFDTR